MPYTQQQSCLLGMYTNLGVRYVCVALPLASLVRPCRLGRCLRLLLWLLRRLLCLRRLFGLLFMAGLRLLCHLLCCFLLLVLHTRLLLVPLQHPKSSTGA